VPSGASTGSYEAVELRDNTPRYLEKGVLKAAKNANTEISKLVIGMDCTKQREIDSAMIKLDGTKNKSRLGANAMLGVSLATARLSAAVQGKPLYAVLGGANVMPVPCMNVINGGKHADNKLQFQEFMICPNGKTFEERLRAGSETYHILKKILGEKFGKSSTNVGDEGGFSPNIKKVRQALDILCTAIKKAGYEDKIKIAIDAASSEFYDKKRDAYYVDGRWKGHPKMMRMYERIMQDYPVFSIEDPFSEDDFEPWAQITAVAKKSQVQIVGDDLLVTNPARIKMALEKKLCSALLLKVNQIGTLTEAVAAANMAKKNGWKVMVSHRSGETTDDFIADLVVGLGTGQIKSGAPCRSERLGKYNQLLRIEEELGKKAKQARI
jgi:enolase